ncbi:hypothetical protein [Stappia indica]|uniref:hypothetical protein n=1 Tax=Stappia indica TaxID=538381 RepID=UPI000834E1D3|nr:hypothetical protein [Stappia indica]
MSEKEYGSYPQERKKGSPEWVAAAAARAEARAKGGEATESEAQDEAAPRAAGGKRKVAAVTGAAREKLEVQAERKGTRSSMARAGIEPGQWRKAGELDETGHIPAGAPVRPLGYDGEQFFFVDTRGQVFNTGGKAMGVERLQILFAGAEDFLCWAWPSYDKKGAIAGFKSEEVRRDLFAACRERGPWSMSDLVRGRGAWRTDDGRLLLHCGEYLWLDGKLRDTGEVGQHFYVRRPAGIVPWPHQVEDDNPAPELFRALRSWNFERGDVDCMIQLGWYGVAMMGAALDWRPSTFTVGDAGAGKSELMKLHKIVLGRSMVSTTNASEAGLYQLVGHDSVPIGIDELEGDDGIEQSQKIIKMARDAASGSVRIRGGADHKGVEFQARSSFAFSAINPPPIPPASMSRLAVLQLGPLKSRDGKVPQLKDPESVGPRLLRRVVDGWSRLPEIYEQYRAVLREAGHDNRGQSTFGTFLACGHLLLGDEGMDALGLPFETLDWWGEQLAADAVPELGDKRPAWLDCLHHILTTPIDNYNHGVKSTPAQVLEKLDLTLMEEAEARSILAAADLGLLPKGTLGQSFALAIPNQSKVLGRMLQDTPYGHRGGSGSWSWALRRGPEPVVVKGIVTGSRPDGAVKLDNRYSVAGQQRRCMFVSLSDYRNFERHSRA